jgi:hypothetical protein
MSSDQCLDYFILDTPYIFKSHLRNPLIVNGLWKVALVEATLRQIIREKLPYTYIPVDSHSIRQHEGSTQIGGSLMSQSNSDVVPIESSKPKPEQKSTDNLRL